MDNLEMGKTNMQTEINIKNISHPKNSNLSDPCTEDFIFYFKKRKTQILFEFWFLLATFFIVGVLLFIIRTGTINLNFTTDNVFYSLGGGFYGGWLFVTKWFYRVTARGKDNQKRQAWEPHKIYWRILTPFLSAILSFAIYALTISNTIPFLTINQTSGMAAFGFSFIIGCFSDIAFSKLFEFATVFWGGNKEEEKL